MRISTPFYMGVNEVTQAQYEAVMGNNPSYFSPKGEGKDKVAGQPNGRVSGRAGFVAGRGPLLQRLEQERRPRSLLPGEWGGREDSRHEGPRLPPADGSGMGICLPGGQIGEILIRPDPLVEYGWFRANSNGSTHPVGKKRPNEFGLYDMAANVWEWCSDEYSAEYYNVSPEADPPGPSGMSTR